jgi:hypothetical protein
MQNRFFGVSTKWHVDQMTQLHTKKQEMKEKKKNLFVAKF